MAPFDAGHLTVSDDVHVVVVGGANTDLIGVSDSRLSVRDSNPGRVKVTPGGVGRNIAENLARLGVDVQLITAFGDDADSRQLAEECRQAGIGLDGAIVAEGVPGARYLAIHDERHDLALGLNDMRAVEHLDAARLGEPAPLELLSSADLVVLDTNLTTGSLEFAVEHAGGPVLLDPVSAPKSIRAETVLAHLAAIKPNSLEAAELLGREVRHADDATDAARTFVSSGVGMAFVTVGATGVAWAGDGASGWLPAPLVNVANTNGAGDAFAAGVAYAMLAGVQAREAAMAGSVMAALTLASEETVNPALSRDRLLDAMKELWG